MAALERTKVDQNNGNELTLYHYYSSFYSQKVVMAFWEKRLKFKSHIVTLSKFEQYEPWFMQMNPNGEVPVLKEGVKIIPDSARIIDYLEDNFSNGDTPRLVPDKGTQYASRMRSLRGLLDKIPIEIITFGCILHPELTKDMKVPPFVRRLMIGLSINRVDVLSKMADKYPDLKESYESKRLRVAEADEKKKNIAKVTECLDELEGTLDKIEEELASHQDDAAWWLCCDRFTIADISLTVLLNRLSYLGLADRYWGQNRRPYLNSYFSRVRQRESFKKACCQVPSFLRVLIVMDALKQKAPYILGAVVVGILLYRWYNK